MITETVTGRVYDIMIHERRLSNVLFDITSSTSIMYLYTFLVSLNITEICYSQTMTSLRDRDSLRKEDKMPIPKVSFVRRLDWMYP